MSGDKASPRGHATIVIAIEPRSKKEHSMFASKMAPPAFAAGKSKGKAKPFGKAKPSEDDEDASLFGGDEDAEPADEEGSEGEEAAESDDQEAAELANVSDDDLIAEMKKRKLRV